MFNKEKFENLCRQMEQLFREAKDELKKLDEECFEEKNKGKIEKIIWENPLKEVWAEMEREYKSEEAQNKSASYTESILQKNKYTPSNPYPYGNE